MRLFARIWYRPAARGVCALALLAAAFGAHAQSVPKPAGGKGLEAVYATVSAMTVSPEPTRIESHYPLMTLNWAGNGPLRLGAQVSLANQPRMSRAVLLSGSLSF